MSVDPHSLMAPYALDALDDDERAKFEAHLDQCLDCQLEIAGFTETAVRLGDAVSQTPPPALRERLLSEIGSTPQQRPVVTALAERRTLRRALPRFAVAAAFVIGSVGVGGYVVERQNAAQEHEQNVAISSVLGADDVAAATKNFDTGGSVKLYSSEDEDSAVILAKGLPSAGEGKVYQVWMIDEAGPTSQGTFDRGGQMIMHGVAGADRVAVTVEPAGGSKQPTSAPIVTLAV